MTLASALPDFAEAIPPEDRRLAERALVAPLLFACDDELAHVLAQGLGRAFDFIVIEGVVLKETTFAARSALERSGPVTSWPRRSTAFAKLSRGPSAATSPTVHCRAG